MVEITPLSSAAIAKRSPHERGQAGDSVRTRRATATSVRASKVFFVVGDVVSTLVSLSAVRGLTHALGILAEANPIDPIFVVPVFLVSCFVFGLYSNLSNPIRRFQCRLAAISLSAAVAALIFAMLEGNLTALFNIGAVFLLLLPLSIYIEKLIAWYTGVAPCQPSVLFASSDVFSRGSQRLYMAVKRSVDYLVVAFAAVFVVPVILLSVLAIKIADPGKAFYWQDRIGRDGNVTRILKLRTMYSDAEARLDQYLKSNSEAMVEWRTFFKLRNDPRILPGIGHFLRRSSLDELPQLWNILRGDMTLVGPRPFPAYHVTQFDPEFQQKRASVTPGLTGLWQVKARSDGDLKTQKTLDLFYIEHQSLLLDLYILIETIPSVLSGKGAR
jgi:lipopolysaccharide/colanic/teichoic acid biosynthesis glycosyltransferase